MFRQLDESAMEAVVSLLQDLPLQPEEVDGGDVAKAKSQLFLKYFTLFMKLLNECTSFPTSSSVVFDSESISESSELNRQLFALREHTISAMSNLLSANIEQGFVHSAGTQNFFIKLIIKIKTSVFFQCWRIIVISARDQHT